MIQQFIELGNGYGDVYELLTLIDTNETRFHQAFIFKADKKVSLAVAFKPALDSKFMPIYICREGIPFNEAKPSKRTQLFIDAVHKLQRKPVTIEVKKSTDFNETSLYYQYLIGILRMHHYIPHL